MSRDSLGTALNNKKDEFYTRLEDIQFELDRPEYSFYFEGKTVYCNCDNCYISNFVKYFVENFDRLKLKRLIATNYAPSRGLFDDLFNEVNDVKQTAYYLDIVEYKPNLEPVILQGDGSFDSEECLKLLDEADVVVTNPPFSLYRDFVALLESKNKKYVLWANNNAIKYKNIFPLIKENKMWVGYTANKTVDFIMPDDYEIMGKGYIDDQGKKHGYVSAISVFTNIDIDRRHIDYELTKSSVGVEYKKFDTYDAICINKTEDIPYDYSGEMGVPITLIDYYNPDQFEIIGEGNHGKDNKYDFFRPLVDGKDLFTRIIIKNRRI